MTIQPFPILRQPDNNPGPGWFRDVWTAVNNILSGKQNVVSEVTLTANAATTTITDSRLSMQSQISYTPLTANASAEIGAGTIYISTRSSGSCVITHANNAQTDRTFSLSYFG